MPSDVLDYVRDRDPEFKTVPDGLLAEYLYDRNPELLKQDPALYDTVVKSRKGELNVTYQPDISRPTFGDIRDVTKGGPPVQLAPASVTAEHIGELLTTPLGELAEPFTPEEIQNMTKGQKIAAGSYNAIANTANSFTSPLGIAALGIGGLPAAAQRAIAGGFAAHMVLQTPEIVGPLMEELKKPASERSPERISELVTSAGLNTFLAGVAAYHGFKPVKPTPETLPQGTFNPEVGRPAPPDTVLGAVAPLTAKALAETPGKVIPATELQPIAVGTEVNLSNAGLEEYLNQVRGEKPVAAATRLSDGTILTGRAHPLITIPKDAVIESEGFVTNKGRYVSRDEAAMLTGGDYWEGVQSGEQSGSAETVLSEPEEPQPIQAEKYYNTTKKGPDYAGSISPTAEVHGDVRAQPGEGVREVPQPEGGERVQPQTEGGLPETPQPETPAQSTVSPSLQMTVLPGAKEFIEQDVGPAVEAGAKAIVDTAKGAQSLLASPTKSTEAAQMAGIVREHAAELARKDVQAREAFAKTRSAMAGYDNATSLDFINKVETGDMAGLSPDLQAVARQLRTAFNERVRAVRALGTGKLQHVIQDYFPHIWKDPSAASSMIARIFGKRPLRGPGTFLKERTIPLTADGVAAGLEPVSWNPIDLTLLKLHEMDRYVMGQKIMNEAKAKGLAVFSRSDKPPPGYAKINDSIANVIEWRPTIKADGTPGAPERIIRGHWFMQEDAARVLNNYLSPGLERFAWYRGLRWVGNNMNMATLGLSGYHFVFTMIDSGTSKLSLGIEQAVRGELKSALTIIRGVAGTALANQLEYYYKGSKVLKEYTRPGSVGGDYAKAVDALLAAGGRTEMPQIFQNSTLKNFFDAMAKGNYPGAILRAPFAAIHATSYPLMNVAVPRIKLGVFMDMAMDAMKDADPNMTRDEFRDTMGKIWDSVDNRMGELVYDNLFWNKTLKDLSFLGVRSVGWNLGTIREFGGAALDSATVLKRLKDGDPAVTRRMAYAVALPITVGMMGAVYMKLRTGKGPEELKDYYFPKTGNLLPNGEPERVNFPSYLKDASSVSRHPILTVIHKAHPMWGTMAEMLQNKDYYGTEIIHPDDPLVQKAMDELAFVGKSFVPYSASGAKKRGEIEPGLEPKVESFFGIMPIPGELTRTPAENLAIELMKAQMPRGSRTKAESERAKLEGQAIAQIKMGKMDIDQAVEKGLVQEERVGAVSQRADMSYLEYATKHLQANAAVKLFEKASQKERDEIETLVRNKIRNSKTLSAEDKETLIERVDKLSPP